MNLCIMKCSKAPPLEGLGRGHGRVPEGHGGHE
jgi:hypothetical protein